MDQESSNQNEKMNHKVLGLNFPSPFAFDLFSCVSVFDSSGFYHDLVGYPWFLSWACLFMIWVEQFRRDGEISISSLGWILFMTWHGGLFMIWIDLFMVWMGVYSWFRMHRFKIYSYDWDGCILALDESSDILDVFIRAVDGFISLEGASTLNSMLCVWIH